VPVVDNCGYCGGTGKSYRYDREMKQSHPVECPHCKGSGKVKPYRVALNLKQAKEFGFEPLNCWGRFAPEGHCNGCGEALTGRKTAYCSRDCRFFVQAVLYVNVHWMKRHIAVRDGTVCRMCGEKFEVQVPWKEGGPLIPKASALELDHICPVMAGGTDHADNLQLLCPSCHEQKTAQDGWRIREYKAAQLHNGGLFR
jgi:5-methylcytosine-specific restriction endonuclease McrA